LPSADSACEQLTLDPHRAREASTWLLGHFSPQLFGKEAPQPDLIASSEDLGVGKDSVDYLVFLTLGAGLTDGKASKRIWRTLAKAFKNESFRYLFYPKQVIETAFGKLAHDMQSSKLVREVDAALSWLVTCYHLCNEPQLKKSPLGLLEQAHCDAEELLRLVLEEYKGKLALFQKEEGLASWIRVVHEKWATCPLQNMNLLPLPVNSHIARSTYRLGCISGPFKGTLTKLSPVINDVWEKAFGNTGDGHFKGELFEPLTHLGKSGCTAKTNGACSHEGSCPVYQKGWCQEGTVEVTAALIEITPRAQEQRLPPPAVEYVHDDEADEEVVLEEDTSPAPAEETSQDSELQFQDDLKDTREWEETEPVPFRTEIRKARIVYRSAKETVRDVMTDVRSGKSFESEKVVVVVNDLLDSIMRNRDAMASLIRIKSKDEYTFNHSVNVCVLTLTLGRHVGCEKRELKRLGVGALLHDVGKTAIPDEVLNKEGKLTDEEFALVQQHTLAGAQALMKNGGFHESSIKVALEHHEKCNGKGYPRKLTKDKISLFGQIAAIADVYDALTTDRVYRNKMLPYEAISLIYSNIQQDFDPVLVERFIQCTGIFPIGSLARLNTGETAVVLTVNRDSLLLPKVLVVVDAQGERVEEEYEIDLSRQDQGGPDTRTVVNPVDPEKFAFTKEDFERWGV
jgi:putative nucleotidyltransferase with HDIG domain